MKCVAFDKYGTRMILESNGEDQIIQLQDVKGKCYQVTFNLQFYDMKQMPVYVEKTRVYIESEIVPENED